MERSFRRCVWIAWALVALTISGCATTYVDNGLKDVANSAYPPAPSPQPVQLIFVFETKGAVNARATAFLKKDVTDVLSQSGLFSTVSLYPVPNGALLSVTINNVPVTDNAFAKGFATGLTLGIAGNVVTDGYLCTIEYLPASDSNKITKTRSHAIHTTVGAKGAPDNATKAPNKRAAAETMTRQVVANTLLDVAREPASHL